MRTLLAASALASLLALTAPASALNSGNWPSELDGYQTACGGFAPVDLACSANPLETRAGHSYVWGIQFCNIHNGVVSIGMPCGYADLLVDAVVHVHITATGYDLKATCPVSGASWATGIDFSGCTVHETGGFALGDDLALSASVTSLHGPVPVGYWRAYLYET